MKKEALMKKKVGQIRKVRDQGGSAMVAIPPAYQSMVDLIVGDDARIEVRSDKEGTYLRVSKEVGSS